MKKPLKDMLQATDDEARLFAKTLVRAARLGALGILDADSGRPVVGRVGLATDLDGAPVFLMSSLSGRGQALKADSRASLLIGESEKGDPLAGARITLVGTASDVTDAGERARLRRRYLMRHPKSKLYIDFNDFGFWRFTIERASLVAGFGRAYALSADDVLASAELSQALFDREEGAVEHMNTDHADAVVHYATALCGAPDGAWRLTGIDPEGVDLMLGDRSERLFFDAPLAAAEELQPTLVALARRTH